MFDFQMWVELGGCGQKPHFSGKGRNNSKDSWEATTCVLL